LVVVEGYMDVIGLARAGIDHAVAPLGTALTETQMRLLWRLAPVPILCFDPDLAGRRAAMRAAERALPLIRVGAGLRFAFLGTDTGDDPDGVARRYPRQFLDRTFADAVSLSDVLFWMETGGKAVGAEERAAAEARMRRRLERIEDRDLRAGLMRDFRQRLWRRPAKTARGGLSSFRRAEEPPPVAATARRPQPAGAVAMAERTLLACLLSHPSIYADGEEDIGSLSFSAAGAERLRQALIEILSSNEGIAGEDLHAALRGRGFGEDIAVVLSDPLLAHHRNLAPDASAQDITALWAENVSVVRAAGEVDVPTYQGAAAMADAAMLRRQLLRRAELDGGEDDVI